MSTVSPYSQWFRRKYLRLWQRTYSIQNSANLQMNHYLPVTGIKSASKRMTMTRTLIQFPAALNSLMPRWRCAFAANDQDNQLQFTRLLPRTFDCMLFDARRHLSLFTQWIATAHVFWQFRRPSQQPKETLVLETEIASSQLYIGWIVWMPNFISMFADILRESGRNWEQELGFLLRNILWVCT